MKALSFFLIKMGCPGSLTLAILFLTGVLVSSESLPSCENRVGPEESGASTSFPKQPWERALDLPDNHFAPQALLDHTKDELLTLLNIGKKKSILRESACYVDCIERLGLDWRKEPSVGFCKSLLERVNALQIEHFNKGVHIPFSFSSPKEKERLYSIVWEYRGAQ